MYVLTFADSYQCSDVGIQKLLITQHKVSTGSGRQEVGGFDQTVASRDRGEPSGPICSRDKKGKYEYTTEGKSYYDYDCPNFS